ncbi:hypothetical protein CEXT_183981 [Caerostris extrusa]|uniref:Uncharacterized protein n=1 Tax=Caerostris extrusa TaxID=172846 RepID=A0AAV4XPG2_CAEEX|nr:hypothetical protein CEXT_183981 [Caerostris extrusa]
MSLSLLISLILKGRLKANRDNITPVTTITPAIVFQKARPLEGGRIMVWRTTPARNKSLRTVGFVFVVINGGGTLKYVVFVVELIKPFVSLRYTYIQPICSAMPRQGRI